MLGPVKTTTKKQLRRKETDPYPVASKGLCRSARSSGRVVHAASKTMDYPMSPQTPQTPQAEMQQLMMEVQEVIDVCGFYYLATLPFVKVIITSFVFIFNR